MAPAPITRNFDIFFALSNSFSSGSTSNVIFALALGALLLTNPLFAIILPDPIRGVFYESPDGVMVLSILDGFGVIFEYVKRQYMVFRYSAFILWENRIQDPFVV